MGILTRLSLMLLFSFNAYSEVTIRGNAGIIFLDDGQIATIKSQMDTNTYFNIKDFFFYPREVKNINSHYFKDTKGNFYAADSSGFVFKYDSLGVGSGLFDQGASFFTNSKGRVYVLKSNGLFVNYKSTKEMSFYNSKVNGGNFFINSKGRLLVIDINGYVYDKTDLFKHTYRDIKVVGNNYFITKDKTLYTIGNIQTLDKQSVMPVLLSKKIHFNIHQIENGGNFFFDGLGNFHTISIRGEHKSISNEYFKNKRLNKNDFIHFGSNYLIADSNELFMIDDQGEINFVLEMDKRVYKTNFKSK